MPTIELLVTGMTCEHCERTVSDAALTVPGITKATATAGAGTLLVVGEVPIDEPALRAAVAKSGYEVETSGQ